MKGGDGGDVFRNGDIRISTGVVGAGKPHNNMSPYVVTHWIIRAY